MSFPWHVLLGVWLAGSGLGAVGAGPSFPPTPASGWKLELLAQAPEILHPGALTCAPDGRIFVAEDPMDIRTERADVAEGRILCFHPDGRRTVFADRVYAAFGLQYLEGRLYALHNPFFSAWEDAGDYGTNRVDLVRHTNPNWHALGWNDHVPANFRLGMDGRFYVATGDKGLFGAVGADGRQFDFFGGGLFRMRPDGTELEPYSTGVRNILDVALDAEDNAFTYDNTDEHEWMGRLTHMVDGGFYGYPHDFIPRRPYTLWCLGDFGAGAATAMEAALDDALPAEYRGNLFLADFGKRNVLRVRLAPAGASFAVVGTNGPVSGIAGIGDTQPLFTATPEDFRPVGLSFTPEGRSLVIGDWNHRDSKDTNALVGRLWKLTWTGPSARTPLPSWYLPAASGKSFTASNDELLAGLGHPSKNVRLCAQRRLVERTATPATRTEVIGQLSALLADRNAGAFPRIHALWALEGIDRILRKDRPPSEDRFAFIRDPDPVVAGQAIRWAGEARSHGAVPALISQLGNPSAALRWRAATALGRIAATHAITALQPLLADRDDWVRYAAFTALNRIGRAQPTAWAEIARGIASPNPRVAEATPYAMRATYDPSLAAALLAIRADTGQPAAARIAATTLLAALCRQPPAWNGDWWAYHPFRTPAPAYTVAWEATPRIREDLLRALGDSDSGVRAAAVSGLTGETNAKVTTVLRDRLVTERALPVRIALIRALGDRHDAEAAGVLATVLKGHSADPALVKVALVAAGQIGGPTVTDALLDWLDWAHVGASPEMLTEAIEALAGLRVVAAVPLLARLAAGPDSATGGPAMVALGRIGGDEARRELLRLLDSRELETRRAALGALAALPGRSAVPELLKAWKEPELHADALLALAREPDLRALDAYLDGLGSRSPEQRAASRKALDVLQAAARSIVEARVRQLPAEVVREIQAIYKDDPAALSGPIFATRSEALTPEAYLEFALGNIGDPNRGGHLFRDVSGLNCIGCHRLDGAGADVGPDLSNMGAQFGPRELAESILWPSRVVREGYQPVIVELRDGDEVSGLIKGESAEILTLRDSAGRLLQMPKADVAGRRPAEQSLMPEGLQAGLTLQEFADLVAFAASCRQGK